MSVLGFLSANFFPSWNSGRRSAISDGAANFHDAYNHEFRTAKLETRTEHIRHIRLAGDFNNNKKERMNEEIKDRERVMRELETKDTPILKGYQLFHNYIRRTWLWMDELPQKRQAYK